MFYNIDKLKKIFLLFILVAFISMIISGCGENKELLAAKSVADKYYEEFNQKYELNNTFIYLKPTYESDDHYKLNYRIESGMATFSETIDVEKEDGIWKVTDSNILEEESDY